MSTPPVRKPVWTTGAPIVLPGEIPTSTGPQGKTGPQGAEGGPPSLVDLVMVADDVEIEMAAEMILTRLMGG